MTSEEFHGLVEECSYDFDGDQRDAPFTLSRLAQLERQKGIRFPAFYKEFLSMYGPGDFGCVTVLSPDSKSSLGNDLPIGEPRGNFIGVVEVDSATLASSSLQDSIISGLDTYEVFLRRIPDTKQLEPVDFYLPWHFLKTLAPSLEGENPSWRAAIEIRSPQAWPELVPAKN